MLQDPCDVQSSLDLTEIRACSLSTWKAEAGGVLEGRT